VKLSICIPTYNRAEFLPATLESIAAQGTDEASKKEILARAADLVAGKSGCCK